MKATSRWVSCVDCRFRWLMPLPAEQWQQLQDGTAVVHCEPCARTRGRAVVYHVIER